MTTSKTENKGTATETKHSQSEPQDLQLAYEIHTLVQMIYGRIAPAPPMASPMNPLAGSPTAGSWVPPMMASRPSDPSTPGPWLT